MCQYLCMCVFRLQKPYLEQITLYGYLVNV